MIAKKFPLAFFGKREKQEVIINRSERIVDNRANKELLINQLFLEKMGVE